MNTESVCSADDEIVRLCLRVNVRNATGRRVAGGSRIGRMEVFVGGALPLGKRNGRAGVANAGEDEGIGSSAPAPILKRSGCRGVDVGSIVSPSRVLEVSVKVSVLGAIECAGGNEADVRVGSLTVYKIKLSSCRATALTLSQPSGGLQARKG